MLLPLPVSAHRPLVGRPHIPSLSPPQLTHLRAYKPQPQERASSAHINRLQGNLSACMASSHRTRSIVRTISSRSHLRPNQIGGPGTQNGGFGVQTGGPGIGIGFGIQGGFHGLRGNSQSGIQTQLQRPPPRATTFVVRPRWIATVAAGFTTWPPGAASPGVTRRTANTSTAPNVINLANTIRLIVASLKSTGRPFPTGHLTATRPSSRSAKTTWSRYALSVGLSIRENTYLTLGN